MSLKKIIGQNIIDLSDVSCILDTQDIEYEKTFSKSVVVNLCKDRKVLSVIVMKSGIVLLCPNRPATIVTTS